MYLKGIDGMARDWHAAAFNMELDKLNVNIFDVNLSKQKINV